MNSKFTILLFFVPFYLFSQPTKNLDYKKISGIISHENKALENVTIFVDNTTRFSVSDAKGFYSINAKVGETISFSYVDLNKISVLIEDVTSILNIDLKTTNRVTNTRFNKVIKLGESNIGEDIIIPEAVKIEGNSLNKDALSLISALKEKIPYISVRYDNFGEEIAYIKGKELNGPVIWDINGVLFDVPLPIFISEVKEVYILNNEKGKSVIKVNTTVNYNTIKEINFDDYYFTDEEYYNFDAIPYEKLKRNQPFLDKYKKRIKATEALEIYTKTYIDDQNITNYHFDLFNRFKNEKNSKKFLLKILDDYEKIVSNNPEDLKALAYKYQEMNELQKALNIYKKIANLRPNYAQSYRDLANIYLELGNYKYVWLTYKFLLKKEFKIEDNDIGEIISSEIISTYNLDVENDINIPKIKIENPNKNIESDIRIVFEWNTTEAEFIIELVNPNLEVFQLENSSANNPLLIRDQKKKGYTSKEIFIDYLNPGDYFVNFTYFGNKQDKTTSFKITTYYNWGRSNQNKKIEVFDFTEKDIKFELLELNQKSLK